ncbi:type II toxin-antitoxin system death-on-curing family toxin [Humibacter sp. RRB41]|uniref:type II toxin-antitoxin system death-on-curing family toxin n=1 Tax=Humibacter sp. RRB41 TaxID=2919946 RepID=UPI001FA9F657|nr:type II toxin-antitoxin system death-on-curing family toxin [Humibacter sp. RRB41]
MIYLDLDDALRLASVMLGGEPPMRDLGLLESALSRSKATYFGDELYPSIALKAAALMHSIAKNHALVDGNKRLALAGMHVFLLMNGHRLTMTNDQAFVFTKQLASGDLDDVHVIAAVIEEYLTPRS